MNKENHILVIDDEQVILDAVQKICSLEGYPVDTSIDAADALHKMEKNKYRMIICDIMMPEINGFELLEEMSKRKINTPVIITTGYTTVENAVKSLSSGAIDFIPKPFTADELINSVARGLKYIELQKRVDSSDKSSIVYVPCPATYLRLGFSSWVYNASDGTSSVGATDLFIKTVGEVSEIELLSVDEEIVQGTACAQICSGGKSHPVLAPLSGRIVDVNAELVNKKNLIEKDPYFKGWFYRIIPSDSEYELKNLTHCSSDRI